MMKLPKGLIYFSRMILHTESIGNNNYDNNQSKRELGIFFFFFFFVRGWKWAGMGRNTVPEVKPPTPSPGAGDVGICFNVTSSLLKEFSQDHTIYKLNCKVKHTTTSSINTSVHFIDVRDHDDAERR